MHKLLNARIGREREKKRIEKENVEEDGTRSILNFLCVRDERWRRRQRPRRRRRRTTSTKAVAAHFLLNFPFFSHFLCFNLFSLHWPLRPEHWFGGLSVCAIVVVANDDMVT